MAGYAELHCWSNFSFLEGAAHPEELIECGAALGLAGIALTDRDGLYGTVRFTKAAAAHPGFAAICGAELSVELDPQPVRVRKLDGKPYGKTARPAAEMPTHSPRLILLAESAEGYANLVELLSIAQLRGRKRDARLHLDDLSGRTKGLVALSGWRNGLPERALLADDERGAREIAAALRDLFPRAFYLELQHHHRPEDGALCHALAALARDLNLPYVATNGVAYTVPADARLADILTCIKYRTSLAEAGMLLRPNAEHYLKSPAHMARIFTPYPQAVSETLAVAERCTFRLDKLRGQFPTYPLAEGEMSSQSYLRTLVYRGAAKRYGTPIPPKAERQLEYELGIIARMDLAGYFLVVWDIVRAAEEMGVLCQGRGSAANSAVCYALAITAVDPIEQELLFERFLSEERNEVPDIDIDFAHQDREKVIQYVYDRWGREHAAMVAEVITYHTRSAIRDVGKALGLSLEQVDEIAKEYDANESLSLALATEEIENKPLPDSIQKRRDLDTGSNIYASRGTYAKPFHNADERSVLGERDSTARPLTAPRSHGWRERSSSGAGAQPGGRSDERPRGGVALPQDAAPRLLTYCRRINGFPRHLGIHSGGMLLTKDPLIRVAPVEWATMRDRSVVQWDKDDLAELGLIKIDLLGLGMLSLLRESFTLYHRCYPQREKLSLATIPNGDKPTYEMMQRADTVGVFQIESRAQQSMLPRLKPACFYDVVIQVAIIRPGPIQGDMVHPFLRRRNGQEPVTYPHPKLEPILKRTLGVPLFQEQGMRMAIEAAGFTPGQADQLRRAMGHKRSRARMQEIYPKLIDGMVENGIERDAAERLFHMLEGFADYGFPESHAASFALLAYASAYVKCHEPAIFLASILNVQPMGFYSTEVLVNDAKRHGVTVCPVTVNASEWWSFVEPGGAVRLGFHLMRGLGEAQRRDLEAALQAGRAFEDVLDFARRTKLSREALENLAAADAFAPWFATRRDAMWALRGLDEREARGELGRGMEIDEPAPRFKRLAPIESTKLDLYATGVAQIQPIALFRPVLEAQNVLSASRLGSMPNNLVCKVGGMVITRQRPGTAKGFVFLTLEDETGLVNVIVRPDIYEKFRRVIRLSNALIVEGKLQKEQGCLDVIAQRIWTLHTEGTTDGVRARNFR